MRVQAGSLAGPLLIAMSNSMLTVMIDCALKYVIPEDHTQ